MKQHFRRWGRLGAMGAVCLLLVGLLCGCGDEIDVQSKLRQELVGVWTMKMDDTEEMAENLLRGIELYQAEIAVVDVTALDFVVRFEFDEEGNYYLGYDAEATKACVRQFYADAFEAMYQNRGALASLSDLYGVQLETLDRESFFQFYTMLYQQENYNAMLDAFAEAAYDYTALSADAIETGTYTVRLGVLYCTAAGESNEQKIGYEVKDDILTLTYSDGEEVYTRSA